MPYLPLVTLQSSHDTRCARVILIIHEPMMLSQRPALCESRWQREADALANVTAVVLKSNVRHTNAFTKEISKRNVFRRTQRLLPVGEQVTSKLRMTGPGISA